MRKTLGLVLVALALPAARADAASVTYLDGNEVWIAALDGSSKVRLSEGEGDWRAVTAADSGRILGVANTAGGLAGLSRIRLWDPQGMRISDGPLPSVVDSASTVIPLAMDLSSDGQFLAYGYSKFFSGPNPSFFEGHYVVNADTKTNNTPIEGSNKTPSFFGREVIAVATDNRVALQAPGTGPFGATFALWFDTAAALPMRQRRVDVAATGTALAFELTDDGVSAGGKIGVVPIAGIGGALNDPAGCFLPVSGLAKDVSISQDARQIAWKDDQGVKVAGIPDFSGVDTCTLTAPPVVVSATGSSPSIGGADAAAIARSRAPVVPVAPAGAAGPAAGAAGAFVSPVPGRGATSPGAGSAVAGAVGPGASPSATLTVAVRAKGAFAALAGRGGLRVTVSVPRSGTVTVRATVPARRLGRRGGPVTIATGSAQAAKAGRVAVRLRRTAAGRRGGARVRGARVTLRIAQGTLRTTRTVTLR